jgi:tRNA-uridine 2-sulfurtransferase
MNKKYKAIALISGGLDSMLAAKMIIDQGIYVEGINFFTGFAGGNTENIIGTPRWAAEKLGIKLNVVDISEEYKNIVIDPKYGYGAHLNPCLDCKIFMVRKTREWLEKNHFDFIITGEVIGQRPKSQLKHMLPIVERDSAAHDILVRPLSAKHLKPTLPEREGWINRELLEDISGRSRKKQIALTKTLELREYTQPAGGCCFLINNCFSNRLRDLWQMRNKKDYSPEDIVLLKIGRHLRPVPHFKMIMGRNEKENNLLESYKNNHMHLISKSHKGPLVLIDGVFKTDNDINLAARITARYCSRPEQSNIQILLSKSLANEDIILNVLPLEENEIQDDWYI